MLGKTLSVLAGLLLSLATLTFMTQTGITSSSTALTPVSSLDVEVAPDMEPVPTNCGIPAEPIAIDPLIPQAVGTWPIWIALPNSTLATTGILIMPNQHYQRNPGLEGWWAAKIAWFVPKSYTGRIYLRGINITDQSPVYFAFNGNDPVSLATLNPDQPGGYVPDLDKWVFFPSHVWVSKAGCYRIEAEWDGGLWQQIIAIGSVKP